MNSYYPSSLMIRTCLTVLVVCVVPILAASGSPIRCQAVGCRMQPWKVLRTEVILPDLSSIMIRSLLEVFLKLSMGGKLG